MSINKKVCHVFECLFLLLVTILLSVGSVDVFQYLSKFDKETHVLLVITFISSCLAWVYYHRSVEEGER